MSFTPNFTSSQTIGAPSIAVFTDTSTGSDVTIASRRITLTKIDQTTLVPTGTTTSYNVWSYGDTAISLNVLGKDYCLAVRVDWMSAGNTILYTKTIVRIFTLYSETFYYSLTQDQTATPDIINDKDYYNSKMALRVEIDSADQAVTFASDQFSAQSALDRAKLFIDNQSFYF